MYNQETGHQKLLLVDGMNLWFQMFYGMPSRIINHEGKAVQGIMGFAGAMLRIIRMTEPTHVLVVFDGEHHNPRTDIDPDYKANRPDLSDVPEEENPFVQLPDAYRVLDLMGIRRYETTVHEADDVIASYAYKYKDEARIVVCSHDSDFYQLIDGGSCILRYRGDKSVIVDEASLMEKYGITGSQYVDFKSLTGDHADNIRGVEGIGPKTASRLMRDYGSLDNLLLHRCRRGRGCRSVSGRHLADAKAPGLAPILHISRALFRETDRDVFQTGDIAITLWEQLDQSLSICRIEDKR